MLDPNHDNKRESLRALGGVLVAIGGILALIGIVDFFSSMSTMRPPSMFWCAFIGLPLLGLGGNLLRLGYLGVATRYVAGEVAPVAKDTINYVGRGTQDTIAGIARAVLASDDEPAGPAAEQGGDVLCPQCGAKNPPDALFCSACGASFSRSVRCPQCGEENAAGAKYCHHCGRALS